MSITYNNAGAGGASVTTQDITNLVPYVGATSDVVLGTNMTVNAVSIGTDLNMGGDIIIRAGQKLVLDGI